MKTKLRKTNITVIALFHDASDFTKSDARQVVEKWVS